MVKKFAESVSERLGIACIDSLAKTQAPPQKNMENSAYQCMNAFNSFSARDIEWMGQKILLIDDIVDSKWTMTVCGYKLMEAGTGDIFPFALADSSIGGL